MSSSLIGEDLRGLLSRCGVSVEKRGIDLAVLVRSVRMSQSVMSARLDDLLRESKTAIGLLDRLVRTERVNLDANC